MRSLYGHPVNSVHVTAAPAKPRIPNVLAGRYASAELATLWSPEQKVRLERQLWLAVLRAQKDLGIEVPDAALADYERVLDQVDLASIAEREKVTRHDVKARIEEFNDLAGHEHVHKGMTSRDLTENVEQLQIRLSLELMRDRAVAVLARLGKLAGEYGELVMAGRSHNVAAQATTLGKRFATAADELLVAYGRVEELLGRYPLRGIKGPVGTAQDMLDLLGGDAAKLAELEQRIAGHLGFSQAFTSVGQVYPRSLDYEVVTALVQLAAAPSSTGQDDPADGRARAGHRGLQAGPGRLLRDAAQDEHPLLRARQRPDGHPARLRVDDRRAGGRPVERGRRVLLGGAPRRAAGRVLRAGRPAGDVPDRARRVRRVPGRRRP